MLVQISCPFTIAQPVPDEVLVEVNIEDARSFVTVPEVGDIVPWVAVHATGSSGRKPEAVVSAAFELSVMSAVTVELPKAGIGLGEALTASTIHGSESTVPLPLLKTSLVVPEHPAPVAPGP
jgi:hypothetical protein